MNGNIMRARGHRTLDHTPDVVPTRPYLRELAALAYCRARGWPADLFPAP